MARAARSSRPRPGKRYDATTKYLFDLGPADWLTATGLAPDGAVHPLETDLSTVTAQIDKLVRVEGPEPWLAHVELQSSRDRDLVLRLLQYNALLQARYDLRVESAVVLLRRSADSRALSGLFRRARPDGTAQLEFRYTVVRVWEQQIEALLGGGLAILPLAPLADVERDELPALLRRVDVRLQREAIPAEADRLWMATFWLSGLRYNPDETRPLFEGIRVMKDSATYQAVLAEGRAEGRREAARELLLRLGTKRFGPPGPRVRRSLASLTDFERIEQLTERLLDVASWDELFPVR